MMMELQSHLCHCKDFYSSCKEKYLGVCFCGDLYTKTYRTEINSLDRDLLFL